MERTLVHDGERWDVVMIGAAPEKDDATIPPRFQVLFKGQDGRELRGYVSVAELPEATELELTDVLERALHGEHLSTAAPVDITCSACGKTAPRGAVACPECGTPYVGA